MYKQLFFALCIGISMLATQANKPTSILPEEITQVGLKNPIKVEYTNYRGEKAIRTIVPISFFFGTTEYHPEEQWLIKLWDVDRQAERVYALKEISCWFAQ